MRAREDLARTFSGADDYERLGYFLNAAVMKNIHLILFMMLSASVVTGYGQQADSIREKTGSQRTQRRALQQPVPAQTTTPAVQGSQYNADNRVMIHHDDIPAIMRETLRTNQYKGWENSTIYQDKTTGEYSIDVNDASTTSPRNYRFDRSGRPIQDPAPSKNGPQKDQ
jgi:hypothetical protein